VTDGDGDYTEHAVWGICPKGDLWALSWWYGQTTSDVWIDRLLDLVERYRPYAWFGESGVIKKSIEPMLIRRMRERRIFCRCEYLPSVVDKPSRARGFQARSSMRKVHIPSVPWGERLVNQLVQFPVGKYDDAVDACSMIAMALDQAHPAIVRKHSIRNKADRWDRAFNRAREEAEVRGWKVI
jgi:predicted phage terminase large subunit-like protein